MTQNLQELRTFLSSVRNIKKFAQICDYPFLVELGNTLNTITAERKNDYDAAEQQRQKQEQKRQEILYFIASEGFSLADLMSAQPPTKSRRRQTKYQYVENGITKQWAGVGRTPRPIQEALDDGKTLDDFSIKTLTASTE